MVCVWYYVAMLDHRIAREKPRRSDRVPMQKDKPQTNKYFFYS